MTKHNFSKRMLADVLQNMWDVYCGGDEMDVAALAVGVDRKTAYNWIAESGGIRPRRGLNLKGRCLSFTDRQAIAIGLELGHTMRSIATGLGRSPSTVSREVNAHRSRNGNYSATHAHVQAWEKAQRPKVSKLAINERLRDRVEVDLKNGYSPEQISGRLRKDFPGDLEMNVHHETIYQGLYIQARGGLKRELVTALRSGRIMRKRRRRPDERRGRNPNMVMISDRPDVDDIDGNRIPGHWEGDLILGKDCKSAIGTVVERATGFTMLLHLPNGHTAEEVSTALIAAIVALPEGLRQSLTWDQGSELSQHQRVSVDAGIDIYFCDPRSPWQRPSNENTNGLLRQYFPKGADLNAYSKDDLAWVEHQFNDRPRKRLDYARPQELMHELLLR